MTQIFEDAFMDVQSSMVSLGLELLGTSNQKRDMLYIYAYQNDAETYFEIFYGKDDVIVSMRELFDEDMVDQVFELGTEDVNKLVQVCAMYEKECPHVLKLIYDINSGKFDADYSYEDVVLRNDIASYQDAENWMKELQVK